MKKIGVFCSACNTIDDIYFQKAQQLGEWMGKEGKTLIYGGSNQGLMECIAKAVKQCGGTIIGVVPTKLEEKGRISSLPDKIYETKNLSDRKDIITDLSDVLVALPGGIGTLDEVFHVMAAASIGYHNKRIVFYNINGFYDKLVAMLNTLDEKHFARHPLDNFFDVANTLEEITELLNQ